VKVFRFTSVKQNPAKIGNIIVHRNLHFLNENPEHSLFLDIGTFQKTQQGEKTAARDLNVMSCDFEKARKLVRGGC
jgi:hypothetical protein